MAYSITITNTTLRNYNLPYREAISDGKSFIRDVNIPAGILNLELNFPSEDVYKTWYNIHKSYLEGSDAIFVIGKTSGSKAEKIYNEKSKKEIEKVEADRKKIQDTDNIIKDELDINMETTVVKGGSKK